MKELAILNDNRIPHPTNATLSSTQRFFTSLPLSQNLLLILLTLFLFCSLARAEWIELDSLGRWSNTYLGSCNGQGLAVFPDVRLSENGQGLIYRFSLYDLPSHRRVLLQPMIMPQGEPNFFITTLSQENAIQVLCYYARWYSQLYNLNGEIIRPWVDVGIPTGIIPQNYFIPSVDDSGRGGTENVCSNKKRVELNSTPTTKGVCHTPLRNGYERHRKCSPVSVGA